jgi:hypothetical protein
MADFKVKKGRNFFRGPKWDLFGKRKSEFNIKACFKGDCKYKLTENYNQINKLAGQSFKILPWYDKVDRRIKPGHHKGSVRFGWRCTDRENIELLAYAYIDGIRRSRTLLFIPTNSWVNLNFRETNKYYVFKAIDGNGESSIVKFKKKGTKKGFLRLLIIRLYPYFGGRIASPHNMTIILKY